LLCYALLRMPRSRFLPLLLVVLCLFPHAVAQIRFGLVDRATVEARLKRYGGNNAQRELTIKQMFGEADCKDVSEQEVKHYPPNVICVLPGETDKIILVGGHTDRVRDGDGVVDNWSSASLLPSLFFSENIPPPRRHTFVFVGFTGEEEGLVGSTFYVKHLSDQDRSRIVAMVNLDTLGLGPTEVWASHADKQLLEALALVANSMKLPIAAFNVDGVGTTDSESFAKYKIPRITIHTITQQTWPILHSARDNFSAVKMDDYYDTYRLLAAYLAFLDTGLNAPQPKPAH
jgi:peptidase M28-like protein